MNRLKHLLFKAATAMALLCIALRPGQVLALSPDQIALVANSSQPQSLELAQFYAQARGIPAERIITIDVPFGEEIPFDRYERQVASPVRKFLRENNLQKQVKCLVTFYGVPIRIADRIFTASDNFEREQVLAQLKQIQTQLVAMVVDVERRTALLDRNFKAANAATTIDGLAQRLEHAGASMSRQFELAADPAARSQLIATINEIKAKFSGPVQVNEAPTTSPVTAPAASAIDELMDRPYDRVARQQIRELSRQNAGIFGYARVLQGHYDYLETKETAASLDSELSLVMWSPYARTKFLPNLLNYKYQNATIPPTLMVMRLDAPKPQQVRDLVANAMTVEREGLKGKFVIDTRGMKPKDAAGKDDAYGVFDEGLRRLATFVKAKTKLELSLDEKPDVLPANSVSDVALYTGWYSVRNYVPGMKFARGAVGYHIASFEMVTLHNPDDHGWVAGLLNSGITSTLGPVAEPYLASFPPPEEFFPLLMTGKVTLAEAYWATNPLASWMQSYIGDPLYNPFGKNPAVKPEDLPESLRAMVAKLQ